jgi:hypothetical protein
LQQLFKTEIITKTIIQDQNWNTFGGWWDNFGGLDNVGKVKSAVAGGEDEVQWLREKPVIQLWR